MDNVLEIVRSLRDPRIIRELHSVSDLDRSRQAHHHTLGKRVNQASPGTHTHDGKDSAPLSLGSLVVDPVATPGGTATVGTTEAVIQSFTANVIAGVRYGLMWTVTSGNTTVAGDRFTFRVTANGVSMGNTVTINFPSTTFATSPVPPIYGTWLSDTTGTVTFDVRVQRVVGTGTFTPGAGFLYLEKLAPAGGVTVVTTGGGAAASPDDYRASVVQAIYSANSATSPKSVTLPSVPSSSNKLLLCSGNSGAVAITGIAQTNVTWAAVGGTTGGAPTAEVWVGTPTGVPGTLVTVTYSSGATFNSFFVAEIAGLGALDQLVTSTAGLPVTNAAGPVITPTKNALVVFVGAKNTGAPNFSAGYVIAHPLGINVAPEAAHGIADTGTVGVGMMISATGAAVKSIMGNVTQAGSTKSYLAVSFV